MADALKKGLLPLQKFARPAVALTNCTVSSLCAILRLNLLSKSAVSERMGVFSVTARREEIMSLFINQGFRPRNMRIGLVGCGNIGADLCIALQKGDIPAEIAALTDLDEQRAKLLHRSFQLDARICSLDDNVASVDFVVESAVADAVKDVADAAYKYGRDCLILSVAGLVETPHVFDRAVKSNTRIHVPAGAISGLDGIRAAMEAGLHSVTITTRKPPKVLAGEAYLQKRNLDLEALDEPLVVFEGSVRDAVKALPLNTNVAASLSIAGIGPDETMVRVIADPTVTNNIHEIVAEGAFGRLKTVTENLPSPRNAKSSYLASLSAVAELRAIANDFVARQAEMYSIQPTTGQVAAL